MQKQLWDKLLKITFSWSEWCAWNYLCISRNATLHLTGTLIVKYFLLYAFVVKCSNIQTKLDFSIHLNMKGNKMAFYFQMKMKPLLMNFWEKLIRLKKERNPMSRISLSFKKYLHFLNFKNERFSFHRRVKNEPIFFQWCLFRRPMVWTENWTHSDSRRDSSRESSSKGQWERLRGCRIQNIADEPKGYLHQWGFVWNTVFRWKFSRQNGDDYLFFTISFVFLTSGDFSYSHKWIIISQCAWLAS
jgi:hypothetical protein